MFLEEGMNRWIVDMKNKENETLINRKSLLELKVICEQITKGPWGSEEDNYCQQIFSNPIVSTMVEGKIYEFMGHGLQLAKMQKTGNGDYWFEERDLRFVIMASKWMLPIVNELLKYYQEEKQQETSKIE